MEIDDRWQSAYGDLDFDAAKFPDAPGMVRQLQALGFRVTVWVMPFVEENSAAYRCARCAAPHPPLMCKLPLLSWCARVYRFFLSACPCVG